MVIYSALVAAVGDRNRLLEDTLAPFLGRGPAGPLRSSDNKNVNHINIVEPGSRSTERTEKLVITVRKWKCICVYNYVSDCMLIRICAN